MPEPSTRRGWTRVAFGDVVQLSRRRSNSPEQDGFERYVGLEHLEPGDLRIRNWGHMADGTTFTSVFRSGQVLFGKRRAYQRKVAVADFDGVCSGDIYVLEPKNERLLPDLLPFICQTDGFFEYAVGTSAGSLSPRTNWKSLEKYEFALPPPEEQRRIADILSQGIETLEALRSAGDRLRDITSSAIPVALADAEMSAGSRSMPIQDLGAQGEAVLKTGPFGSKLKTEYFRAAGRPIITIGSIKENGLDEEEFFYLEPTRVPEFSEYETRENDIVFSRVADVGRCHLIRKQESGYIVSSNLIRIRANPNVIRPRFLWLSLRFSGRIREQIARFTNQAAGRLLVNTGTMAMLRFSVPPTDIQEDVIGLHSQLEEASRKIESRLSEAARFLVQARTVLVDEGRQ